MSRPTIKQLDDDERHRAPVDLPVVTGGMSARHLVPVGLRGATERR